MDEWSVVILTLLIVFFPLFRQIFFRKNEKQTGSGIKRRLIFFDVLKGLAIIAVIFIHVTFFFTHTEGLPKSSSFLNIVNNLFRFAIPFFLICSGILLNPIKNKKELQGFYTRKLIRIIVPYFLVTVFLFFVNPVTVKTFLYQLVTGQASVPFYFVLLLIQLYLLFPLLSKWRYKKWFLPVSFFISALYFVFSFDIQPFGFPVFVPFLFFFCYGMYYRERFLNYSTDKYEIFIWLMMILIDVLLMVWGQDYYYNQRFFYGVALFNVLFSLRHWIIRQKMVTNILLAFGRNSLWIFLIHFSLMWAIYPYFWIFNLNYYLVFILFTIVSIGASYLVALFCQLIYEYAIKKLTPVSSNK